MKFLIVDDEPLALMRLEKMLKYEGVKTIITANNGKKGVDKVKEQHPHVVILDIEMPVMTGVEAANQIKQISPETKIIFCTAYDEFALKAFDLAVSDYLLKPVSQDRLKVALEKIGFYKQTTSLSFQFGNDLISLDIDEIYCFVSHDKTTTMYCQLGTVIIDDSLLSLEKMFADKIIRINRNALVTKTEFYGIHREKGASFAKLRSIEYQPQISRRNISTVKGLLV